MRKFTTAIDIQAPPERVWTVWSDIERWPEWTPTMVSIERLDRGPFSPGSRARIRQPKMPAFVWTVTKVDDDRGFTWTTRSPGVLVTAHHTIEPLHHGSRATMSIEYDGPFGGLVAWLTRELNHRYLRLEAEGLKRRSETEGPAPPGVPA
jgi:uncharacterized membrane protein